MIISIVVARTYAGLSRNAVLTKCLLLLETDMLNRCETALLSTEVGVDVDAESGSANYEKRLEAQQVLANAMTSTNIDCDGLAWIVLRDLVLLTPAFIYMHARTHTLTIDSHRRKSKADMLRVGRARDPSLRHMVN